jgi:hypothetical protein
MALVKVRKQLVLKSIAAILGGLVALAANKL